MAAGVLLAALAAIYLPAVGHGFVKDDFVWIARSRLETPADWTALFGAPTGFFRPVVSLTFAANRWMCGLHPLCYGLTNLALALGCAAGIFVTARGLSLPRGAALLAAALWAFNWHGVNMAVLWISGRTALIVVLLSSCAAAAFLRQRYWAAVALSFVAMLSKEEAVLLPVVLLAWGLFESRLNRSHARGLLQFAAGSAAIEMLYFVLRGRSGAFTPASAPSFYRLSFSLPRLGANLPAYFDRSATFALVALLLFAIVCRPRLAALRGVNASAIRFGLLWWVGTLALTVFLPVRSSLYACMPSVGVAIAGAALVAGAWPSIDPRLRRRAIWVGLAIPFVLWPVYHARNRPSVREAELSSATIHALQAVAAERGGGTVVLLRDDRTARPSFDQSFGTLVQEAAALTVSPPISVWIDPPPADAVLAGLTQPPRVDVELAVSGGRITRTR